MATGRFMHSGSACMMDEFRSDHAWKAGQAYQRNPIDWSLVDSMHDHRMAECMQSYVCLVLISVRDKVMVAGVFHIRDKSRNL